MRHLSESEIDVLSVFRRLPCNCVVYGFESLLCLGVPRLHLEGFLVRILCPDKVSHAMQGSAFAAIALAPVGIEFDCFVCVVEGLLEVSERCVAC